MPPCMAGGRWDPGSHPGARLPDLGQSTVMVQISRPITPPAVCTGAASAPVRGGAVPAPAPSSAPRPISQPDKAEAGHAGLAKVPSQHSIASESMSSASGEGRGSGEGGRPGWEEVQGAAHCM